MHSVEGFRLWKFPQVKTPSRKEGIIPDMDRINSSLIINRIVLGGETTQEQGRDQVNYGNVLITYPLWCEAICPNNTTPHLQGDCGRGGLREGACCCGGLLFPRHGSAKRNWL